MYNLSRLQWIIIIVIVIKTIIRYSLDWNHMDPEPFRSVDPGPDWIKDPREPTSKILPVSDTCLVRSKPTNSNSSPKS